MLEIDQLSPYFTSAKDVTTSFAPVCFIKLKLVDKKTTRNKKKIIFKVKSNLVVKIFDLKWKKIQLARSFKI